ncbi:tryptophan 7-halogenase [Hahella sp. CR1]|uniref:FAD-dependent oxidoreductase n=1 Tax=Hahella sp. CR1 TaxID=2992807 RepID=UPI002441F84F|nr:FAD-dependent oxidoreductase [Hahella sp. CR1]MDG9669525.1 tryptophan 7-halogenase [Hahella sp. CR1]
MKESAWDVFIAGTGPAGSATALSLAAIAPELRVCMANAGLDDPFRVGESVPPLLQQLLAPLGLWDSFLRERHSPTFRTLSAWGRPYLEGNEFFLQVHNTGWRIDRMRFDRWLAAEAEQRGATVVPAKVHALAREKTCWRVNCGEGGFHTARCVVDATGRGAFLMRMTGVKATAYERQVACVRFFQETADTDQPGRDATVVEAFEHGWWYSAGTPGGQRVVAMMTDSDQVRHLGAAREGIWRQMLAQTTYVRPLVGTETPLGPLRIWPAGSRCIKGFLPDGLIPVGDAMSCFDPLSSQGILKALRSGVLASYAIADSLVYRRNDRGYAQYGALMRREFDSYREIQQKYYRQEQRWPDSPFWRRRHLTSINVAKA